MPQIIRRSPGFSLIEMALVMVIGSLILGAAMQYLTAQLITARQSATRTKQESIKSALVAFIARNNRLPCPAVATNPAGNVGNGIEAPNAGTCTGSAVVGSVATGTIPWASLGLPSESSLDGYGNRFTYQVALAATGLTSQTVPGMRGAITVHTSAPATVGSPSASAPGNQINDCRSDLTVAYVSNANPCAVVVVVVSHGADGYGAYTDAGVQIAIPPALAGLDESENANADSTFVVKQYSSSQVNPYDDTVLALTPSDLLTAMIAAGGMLDSRTAVTNQFNLIRSAVVSSAVQSRGTGMTCVAGSCSPIGTCSGLTPCGVPFFTYTVLAADTTPATNTIPVAFSLPAQTKIDPWGNAIQYAVTTAAISPTSSPVSIAFALNSSGPDGVAGTSDDLTMTVYVGELQALLAKY